MFHLYYTIVLASFLIKHSESMLSNDAPNNKVILNSDDDDLNQALFLIDMLKSEYLKLLRDHSVPANSTAPVEQSTCAATAGFENQSSSRTRKENIETIRSLHRKQTPRARESAPLIALPPWHDADAAAAPLPSWLRRRLVGGGGPGGSGGAPSTRSLPFYNMPRRAWDRPFSQQLAGHWNRFYPEHYFYNVHPRRFYKDPPDIKKRPTTISAANTANIIVVQTTTAAGIKWFTGTNNTKTESATGSSSNSTWSSERPTKRPPKPTRSQKTTNWYKNKNYKQTKKNQDPLQVEVASELLKEFKQINFTLKTSKIITIPDSSSAE